MSESPLAAGAPQELPTSTQIYDSLMSGIEPELVSANIPVLDERYQSETPEDRAARYARYTNAYKEYDKAFAQWSVQFQTNTTSLRRIALASAESKSREEEVAALASLEQSFADISQ